MQNAAQTYLNTQVHTTDTGELIVLLFQKAVRCLTQAKEKIDAKDVAAKGQLISKVIDIISTLDASLNVQQGGEVATNLHSLYMYCSNQLLLANLRQDKNIIDGVIQTLTELQEAFKEVLKDPAAQAVAAELTAKQAQTSSFVQRNVTTSAAPVNNNVSTFAAKNAYSQMARTAQPVQPVQLAQPAANVTASMPVNTATNTQAPVEAVQQNQQVQQNAQNVTQVSSASPNTASVANTEVSSSEEKNPQQQAPQDLTTQLLYNNVLNRQFINQPYQAGK